LRRARGESGQASIELAGSLLLIIFTALAVWQVLIVMWTFNQTSNAARTAARVESRGGDTKKATRNALPNVLRKDLDVKVEGDTAKVTVLIPIFVPGLYSHAIHAKRDATVPK
jgi:TadE-like protein